MIVIMVIIMMMVMIIMMNDSDDGGDDWLDLDSVTSLADISLSGNPQISLSAGKLMRNTSVRKLSWSGARGFVYSCSHFHHIQTYFFNK